MQTNQACARIDLGEDFMRLLITGGSGFIGSRFVHYLLDKYPRYDVFVLDKLTYAGNFSNLEDVREKITFLRGDICSIATVKKVIKNCDVVVNFAAETHVDRSIIDAGTFVKTDVFGTYVLLEQSRKSDVKRFIQISTDEVYGSIATGSFNELDPLNPSSPYAASKSSADLLSLAYHETYGLPVMITRSSNNYGSYQHPEKLVSKLIIMALRSGLLPIYGDGLNVRDWIYVADNCEAIDLVLHKGKTGEIYNIAGGTEKTNIEVAKMILGFLGKPERLITFVKDRLGHDRRYSLDYSKIRELGWSPRTTFEDGLEKTVNWYVSNEWWWTPLLGQMDMHNNA